MQQVHTHASGKRSRTTLSVATAAAERDYFDYYEAIGAYDDEADGRGGCTEADLRLAASFPILPLISELRTSGGGREQNGKLLPKLTEGQIRSQQVCDSDSPGVG